MLFKKCIIVFAQEFHLKGLNFGYIKNILFVEKLLVLYAVAKAVI